MKVIVHHVALFLDRKIIFKTGYMSLTNDPRCENYIVLNVQYHIEEIQGFILLVQKVTLQMIMNVLHLSYGSLGKNIHKELTAHDNSLSMLSSLIEQAPSSAVSVKESNRHAFAILKQPPYLTRATFSYSQNSKSIARPP